MKHMHTKSDDPNYNKFLQLIFFKRFETMPKKKNQICRGSKVCENHSHVP